MLNVSSFSTITKSILNNSGNTTSRISLVGISSITGEIDDLTTCNNSTFVMTISTTSTVLHIFKVSVGVSEIDKNGNKARFHTNIDLQSQSRM